VRFYAVAAVVLAAAIVGKVVGADDFRPYPTVQVGLGAPTLGVCAVVLASGLAPWRGGRRLGARRLERGRGRPGSRRRPDRRGTTAPGIVGREPAGHPLPRGAHRV
jgi:hypothetical protein